MYASQPTDFQNIYIRYDAKLIKATPTRHDPRQFINLKFVLNVFCHLDIDLFSSHHHQRAYFSSFFVLHSARKDISVTLNTETELHH